MVASECEFRFYEELNDFLAAARRRRTFAYRFNGTPAVKDAIEAVGVPHTEVDLILVNGETVCFSHRLRGFNARDDNFARCDSCGRFHWPGTHFGRLGRIDAAHAPGH